MSEVKLCRSIILDSGELVKAGTTLKNYGDNSLFSVAPSQNSIVEKKGKKLCKSLLKRVRQDNIVNLFRLPRECVSETSMDSSLKKKWVKGDERIAPFPCIVRAKRLSEVRSIELLKDEEPFGPGVWEYYDKKFNNIRVITISSLMYLTIGNLWRLGHLKSVNKLASHFGGETCIVYYYPSTDQIKVEPIYRRKFYVNVPTYRFEKKFNELSVGQRVLYYSLVNGEIICQGYMYVLDAGDNEWYAHFRQAHSWLDVDEYQITDNDTHLFVKIEHKDGKQILSRLAVIHNSTNYFLFFLVKRHMVLIKDDSLYH